MKDQEFDKLMDSIREMGMSAYPSPFYGRSYQFPAAYPPASLVKHHIVDPLGVMLFAVESWQKGVATGVDLETQTASFMVRHRAWRSDFPLYLVTEELSAMLLQTDRLDAPNVDLDSKPPFPAGFFILPKHLLGVDSNKAYVVTLGYAVLAWGDTADTPIRFPEEMRDGARRLYITAEMSDGTGYYAKLEISDTGEVQNPKDSPYSEDPNIGRTREVRGEEQAPRFSMANGPAVLDTCANFVLALFTYLNMDRDRDTMEEAVLTGKAKAKRDKPAREFWKPAVIGTSLRPTGHATQGSHASPHSHIRRGHWRWQHYGEGNTQKKRLWIKPVLVMGRSD